MLLGAAQEDEWKVSGSDTDMMTNSASLPDPASTDRKAIRKEKNRASAAASRARREAYTQSLEEEVRSRCTTPWLLVHILDSWEYAPS